MLGSLVWVVWGGGWTACAAAEDKLTLKLFRVHSVCRRLLRPQRTRKIFAIPGRRPSPCGFCLLHCTRLSPQFAVFLHKSDAFLFFLARCCFCLKLSTMNLLSYETVFSKIQHSLKSCDRNKGLMTVLPYMVWYASGKKPTGQKICILGPPRSPCPIFSSGHHFYSIVSIA